MKYLMHLFKWLMLLTLLVSAFGNSLLLLPGKSLAVQVEQQVLLDSQQLKVSARSVEQADQVHWVIDYEKRTTPNEQFKFKLKIPVATEMVEQPEFERQSDWLVEKEFTSSTKGTIELLTNREPLVVNLQLDQRVDQNTTVDILTDTDAGPYTLTLPQTSSTESEKESERIEQPINQPSQVPTASTSSQESANQTSQAMVQSESEIADGSSLKATQLVNGLPRILTVTRAISDPFHYTTHDQGTHATNGVDQHLGIGTTSELLKNYHYGLTESDSGIAQYNLDGSNLSFKDGYHEYGSAKSGRANLKKTVQPTTTANQFKVQLDVIGDAIQPMPKIDVVLVLDKSGSMKTTTSSGKTRWQDLKAAVNQFSAGMLTDDRDIQIGLAAFGSTEGSPRRPYGEIAAFDNKANQNKFAGFTNNKTTLMGHKLLTEDIQTSGTPTFLGVDAGIKLLTNADYGARADAYKVLITITDGEPTFSPSDTYAGNKTLDQSLGQLTPTFINGNSILKMTAQKDDLYSGNGTVVNNPLTVKFIEDRYKQQKNANLHRYGIGYHTGNTANTVVGALGPEGTYTVSAIATLVTALQNIIDKLIATIAAANVTDPLSEFVNYVPGSLKGVNLVLKDGKLTDGAGSAQQPTITSGKVVKMADLHLGADQSSRQGYRITYDVLLKEAYRDGKFYPANETTYLTNGNGANMYFAVPSIRSIAPKPYQITLKKENGFGAGLGGAEFKLSTKDGTPIETVTSDSNGAIKFTTNLQTGDYLITETKAPAGYELVQQQPWQLKIGAKQQVTLTDAAGQTEALTVGPNDDYWQITPKGQNGVIINQHKPFDLGILKRDALTQKVLAGAEFTLYDTEMKSLATLMTDDNGQGQFKIDATTVYPLKAGQAYHIKETKAPNGYLESKAILKVVIGKDGQVTVTKDGQADTQVKLTEQSIQLTIDNTPVGGHLPATGGSGWRQYQYWAAGLMAIALILSGYYGYQKKRSIDKK